MQTGTEETKQSVTPRPWEHVRKTGETDDCHRGSSGTLSSETGFYTCLSGQELSCQIYAIVKRFMDIILAGLGIVLTLPLWILIGAAIRMESKGPVFFTQLRAGKNGKPFRMVKFRSMVQDAEEQLSSLIDIDHLEEPVFKIQNDPRVTRVGRILRRWSLDELPQLLNVIKGEMSIVGPRPEEVRLTDKYTGKQLLRLSVLPGITGYQQIKNRGTKSLAQRLEYDIRYLKKRSVAMDIYILFATVYVVLAGKGTTH